MTASAFWHGATARVRLITRNGNDFTSRFPVAPEIRRTDSAPIRATAPLIELYYVAVDRQLKSGFETYEAAEKVAQDIKKRHPNLQVTVFDVKKRGHTAVEQPLASTKRRG